MTIEGRMTNAELEKYLGIDGLAPELRKRYLDALEPKRRAVYDRMAKLEVELRLWQDGLGPKPNALIDGDRHGSPALRKQTRRKD